MIQDSSDTQELKDFSSFPDTIARALRDMGWSSPMPVQARVVPVWRRGTDCIVQAVTGSGKTGAFGLPMIEKIDPALRAVQGLVLAPTRELAGQICGELNSMGRYCGIEAFPIYGGTAYGPQLDALSRGVHIIVGTPGRILDHLNERRLRLDRVRMLIFDEADELLSLGFWPDMKEIRSFLPEKRQTGLFSATIPERVKSLSRNFLTDPEFISLTEGGVRSPEEIEHYHYIVSAQEKHKMLLRVLEYEQPESAIVFCNTRDDVRFVTAYLQRSGVDADMIQGEMSQGAREDVMRRIKAGELRYLVATDVAARGIDISDLSHVIAYNTGVSPDVYLHRTGRTGRAGKTGTAISLVSGLDIGNLRATISANRMAIPERPMPSEADVAERRRQRLAVNLEHELRHIAPEERAKRVARSRALVDELAASESGRADLAVLIDRILHPPAQEKPAPAPVRGTAARPQAQEDEPESAAAAGDRPRRRRRRPRRGGR
jgi:ATP-dependent RNA helicase DeaD